MIWKLKYTDLCETNKGFWYVNISIHQVYMHVNNIFRISIGPYFNKKNNRCTFLYRLHLNQEIVQVHFLDLQPLDSRHSLTHMYLIFFCFSSPFMAYCCSVEPSQLLMVSTRQKLKPNVKSLATFSYALGGIQIQAVEKKASSQWQYLRPHANQGRPDT